MPRWTEEQNLAINEDNKNIIVSAGAGSGKTAVLSERVIRKLKQGTNINELLILTFTNAAAKEMKERIRKKIYESPELNNQLDLIDQSYITTFDSFALSTVKKYHYLLNISKNRKIADESLIKMQKEKIVEDIFNRKYEEKDELFEKLISDFCIKDDLSIKNAVIDLNNKLDLKSNKVQYMSEYITNYFNEEKIDNDIKMFERFLVSKIEEIKVLLDELYFIVDGEYFYKFKESIQKLLDSSTYDGILNNLEVSLPRLTNNVDPQVKKIKEEISNIIKNIKILCKYKDINEIKNQIYNTKNYVNIIIQIILELDERIMSFKKKNDMFEFNDIALLLINLLKNNNDIRMEMKNYFKEIMIDEYQDTNDIQEEFISLIENNNVYMVGDIKQSIYRFRNANPYIFKNKYDNYSENLGGLKIDLNKNFRSRKEVLNNINCIFEKIMDDYIGGADYKASHKMIFGNTAYDNEGRLKENSNLQIYNYNYDKSSIYSKEEIEAFIIANDIKNKIESKYKVFDKDNLVIRNVKYSDFVILMDRSTNFSLYKKIFEYLSIPLTIYKDEKISEDIILSIVKNLLSLIISIHNNEFDTNFKYDFISIARSPLFNKPDDEIFKIFMNNSFKDNDIYLKCFELSNLVDNTSICDFIRLIINKFDFYKAIIKMGNITSNITKLDYLINLTENFSSLGLTIEDFTDYLNDIITKKYDIRFSENKENSESVKIMTIHKSKGLEYHICYYSGLYSSFNISDLNEKFIYDNTYGIIVPEFNNGIDTTIYKELLKDNYIKEEISERIRVFYVALTRAKEKMIIICDLNDNKEINPLKNDLVNEFYRIKYRSFKDIILSIKDSLSDYIFNVDLDKYIITKDYNLIKKSNYTDYIEKNNDKIIVNELKVDNVVKEEKSFSKKENELINRNNKENMNLGNKIHYILESIDFIKNDLSEYDVDDYLKNKISSFLENDILKNIKNGKIYKEYEFMYEEDNIKYHGIIDLMVVYDDYVDIIDYKLKNVIDDSYVKQLNGYKQYIEKKLKKKTNLYLYSIFDEVIKIVG